jgi:hypothetical protein
VETPFRINSEQIQGVRPRIAEGLILEMHVPRWFLKETERVGWIFFSNVGRRVSIPPFVEGIGRVRELTMFGTGSQCYLEGTALAFWISLR